ncbi:putative glycine-rich RNA-binding protein 2, mitochondrial-like [Capsicum annuum]|nr:putative glycine-rich RNA-binding protein 2, mitochondrial-like [Capsicum annuum]
MAVVMVPIPAQGHLIQLLHLSRLICMYNIQVHYIGSTTHIRQAKIRAHGFDPLTRTKIHFHEFVLTPFETPQPNPNAFHKFPNQLIPSFYATYHLRKPLCSLVRTQREAFHPGSENYEDTQTIGDCFPPEFWEFLKIQAQFVGKINCGELYDSSRVIESLYLDLMAKECDKLKKWAIGPFNPMESQEKNKDLDKIHESLK